MRASYVFLVASVAVAGCTTGQAGVTPPVAVAAVAQSAKLQLAVGTATIALANGQTSIGLNVVATFRGPGGNNATGVNTPTLTAPVGTNFGDLLGSGNVIAGLTPSQLSAYAAQVKAADPTGDPTLLPPPPGAFTNGFGPLVGVYGYGLASDNFVSAQTLGTAVGTVPNPTLACYGIGIVGTDLNIITTYGPPPNTGTLPPSNVVRSGELRLPIPSGQVLNGNPAVCNCPGTCGENQFFDPNLGTQFFGGPPAWPSPQGYGNYSYFVGYPLGFTAFVAAPVAGTYGLSVAYPTSADYSTYGQFAASATLPQARVGSPLPVLAQPVLTVNTDGSGTIDLNVPAGLREVVVTIASNDCDLAGRELSGSTYTNHFALFTRTAGQQKLFLSANLGPPNSSGQPTHTFCTLDDVLAFNAIAHANGSVGFTVFPLHTTVAAAGFDYPAYESSYPFDTSLTPAISTGDGHTGSADVTLSYPFTQNTNITVPAGS